MNPAPPLQVVPWNPIPPSLEAEMKVLKRNANLVNIPIGECQETMERLFRTHPIRILPGPLRIPESYQGLVEKVLKKPDSRSMYKNDPDLEYWVRMKLLEGKSIELASEVLNILRASNSQWIVGLCSRRGVLSLQEIKAELRYPLVLIHNDELRRRVNALKIAHAEFCDHLFKITKSRQEISLKGNST